MNIEIFENSQFGQIRCLNKGGEPWFVGKDVASALGYANPRKALIDHVDDDDKKDGVTIRDSIGRIQTPVFINESGLYSLIFSSKLDSALKFKRWVTAEVLPQIRKTGGYIPVSAEDGEKEIMARALMVAHRTIKQKDELIEAQRPSVKFAEAVTSCEDSILIRDLAKLITQNGVKIGQGRLFYWMRLNGYLFKKETRPMQKWVEAGLFDTNVTIIETNHGTKERITTKVTGKGQRYFIEGFVSGKFKYRNEDLG